MNGKKNRVGLLRAGCTLCNVGPHKRCRLVIADDPLALIPHYEARMAEIRKGNVCRCERCQPNMTGIPVASLD